MKTRIIAPVVLFVMFAVCLGARATTAGAPAGTDSSPTLQQVRENHVAAAGAELDLNFFAQMYEYYATAYVAASVYLQMAAAELLAAAGVGTPPLSLAAVVEGTMFDF